MSVDPPRNGADDEVSALAVGQRTFPVGFRGFDQAEVREYLSRVSAEMRALQERADGLQQRLAEVSEKAAHPELDEDLVFGAVGEETASLLRSARSAAAEVRTRATEESSRLIAEATERGHGIIAEAEAQLGRATAEAEAAGESIRAEAQRDAEAQLAAAAQEADRVIALAHASAEALRAKSEQDARHTVEGAQAVREKTLADLARRRRVAMVQIEQLRVGRERLLEAYGVVRRTLQEVHEELRRADEEARSAAFETGRRLREDALPEDSGEIPIVNIVEPGDVLESDEVLVVEVTAADPLDISDELVEEAAAEVLAEAVAEALEEAVEEAVEQAVEAAVEEAAEEAVAEALQEAAEEILEEVAEELLEDALEEAVEEALEEALEEAAEEAIEEAAEEALEEADEIVETARETLLEEEALEEKAEAAVAETEAGNVKAGDAGIEDELDLPLEPEPLPDEPPRQEASVEDLFARIRAGRDVATAEARAALHLDEPDGDLDGDEGDLGEASLENDDDLSLHAPRLRDDEELLQRRDAALAEIDTALAKRLKRFLQDDQNTLLDRLRSGAPPRGGEGGALGSIAKQRDTLATAVRPILEESAHAGGEMAMSLLSLHGAPSDASHDVEELAKSMAEELVGQLRTRLEGALDEHRGEDYAALSDAVSPAFREWKSDKADLMASEYSAAAFSLGVWRASPRTTHLRWVVEDVTGACPDCDDNALAGALPRGEAFPTGQLRPPAHPGCRCLLVPSVGSSADPGPGNGTQPG